MVGVQSLTFGLITRRYATRHRLLPGYPKAQKLLDAVTLERLLQTGGALACAGLIGLAYAVSIWADQRFGTLPDGTLLRGMALSTSAIVIAMQIILSAFLLGVLDMRPDDARSQQQRLKSVFPHG